MSWIQKSDRINRFQKTISGSKNYCSPFFKPVFCYFVSVVPDNYSVKFRNRFLEEIPIFLARPIRARLIAFGYSSINTTCNICDVIDFMGQFTFSVHGEACPRDISG